jgi:F0F1-type ATP synthase beta subunit
MSKNLQVKLQIQAPVVDVVSNDNADFANIYDPLWNHFVERWFYFGSLVQSQTENTVRTVAISTDGLSRGVEERYRSSN